MKLRSSLSTLAFRRAPRLAASRAQSLPGGLTTDPLSGAGAAWRSAAALAGLLAVLGCEDLEGAGDDADTGTSLDVGADDADPIDAPDAEPNPWADIEEPTLDLTGLDEVRVRFDLESTDFWGSPWPSDLRRRDDGSPDLTNFPQGSQSLIRAYRASMEGVLDGFSTQPVVTFPLDLAADAPMPFSALPVPAETMNWDSHVQLVELAPRCGRRVPVEVTLDAEGDVFSHRGSLRVAPVLGFVLEPSATYAALVLRTLGNDEGVTIAPDPLVEGLLDGSAGGARALAAWQPLRDCAPNAAIFASTVGAASVFTTQDPVRQTRALRDFVALSDRVNEPQIVSFGPAESQSRPNWTVMAGTYLTPIFQEGTSPYAQPSDGGSLAFDAQGEPIVQRYEEVPFSIAWPPSVTGPLDVLVWVDGTGASQFSHIRNTGAFVEPLARGFAVANFQPQFHAGRGGPGSDEVSSTFNYLNPASGRSVFRQQVADTVYFNRLLRQAESLLPGVPPLNTDRMVYGGHSQGALVGAMLAGVESDYRGYFLNGVGASLAVTIVERKDPLDISNLIGTLLRIRRPIDRFHPVVQLAQMGGDTVDPANYAPAWKGWPGHPDGNHVYFTNGNRDETTHETAINALTIAGDAAPMAPAGWNVDPFGVWTRGEEAAPLRGNRTAQSGRPLTLVSYLRDGSGHFTIYRHAEVMLSAADFMRSAVDDTVPTVAAP
jgi:hypothetical protein